MRVVALITSLVWATPSLAQQAPKEFDQREQVPGEHQAPETNRCQAQEAKITQLNRLVKAQDQKISLLQEKVKVLESELAKARGPR